MSLWPGRLLLQPIKRLLLASQSVCLDHAPHSCSHAAAAAAAASRSLATVPGTARHPERFQHVHQLLQLPGVQQLQQQQHHYAHSRAVLDQSRGSTSQHDTSSPPEAVRYRLPVPAQGTLEDAERFRDAAELVGRLQEKGQLAFIAGGWVRDRFLGRSSPDIDISTTATVFELQRLLGISDVTRLHQNTARVRQGSHVFEVSTFKGTQRQVSEVPVQGHKNLAVVNSVEMQRKASDMSAYMDACLRDFTINSLLYDPVADEVLDYVGAVPDIQNRVLRMNHSRFENGSWTVFMDDPVRVLRGVRFALQFGLEVEPETLAQMRRCMSLCRKTGPLWLSLQYREPSPYKQSSRTSHAQSPSDSDTQPLRISHARPLRVWRELRKLAAVQLLQPPEGPGQQGVGQVQPEGQVQGQGGDQHGQAPAQLHEQGTTQAGMQGQQQQGQQGQDQLQQQTAVGQPLAGVSASLGGSGSSHVAAFPEALRLFKRIGLLYLLFDFLNEKESVVAVQAWEVQRRLPASLPLELRIMGLVKPVTRETALKEAEMMLRAVGASGKKREGGLPSDRPDLELVGLYYRFASEQAKTLSEKGRVHKREDWIDFLAHPGADDCIAVMAAWIDNMYNGDTQEHAINVAYQQQQQQRRRPDRTAINPPRISAKDEFLSRIAKLKEVWARDIKEVRARRWESSSSDGSSN